MIRLSLVLLFVATLLCGCTTRDPGGDGGTEDDNSLCGPSNPSGLCQPGCECRFGTCVCSNDQAQSALTTCSLPAPDASIVPTRYSYGADSHQIYDVYRPSAPVSCARTIIAVCGGGFTNCNLRDGSATTPTYEPFARMRASATYNDLAISISYRFASSGGVNKFPAALTDVREILRELASPDPANPSQTLLTSLGGCDSRGVALVGWSAGASLAAQAAETLSVTTLPHGTALPDVSIAAGLVRAVVVQSGPHDLVSTPASDTSAAPPSSQTSPIYFASGPTFPEPAIWADGSSAISLPSAPLPFPWLVMDNPSDIVVYPWMSAGTAVFPLRDGRTGEGLDPALRRLGNVSSFVASNDIDGDGVTHKPARIHLAALHAPNTPQGCATEAILAGL